MPEQPVALGFLFARLTHPEGMVRERACAAIARLLSTTETAGPTREGLWAWMEEQRLESVAGIALLVWIRSAIDNPTIERPDSRYMARSFPRPSLLSWLLLRELYGQSFPEPDWTSAFSADRHRDFEPDPFFLRHAVQFVPKILAKMANRVARETGAPVVEQWAWEWSRLVDQVSLVPDGHVLQFRGDSESDLHVSCDFRLSEIYRSAYLRTLAWAMLNGIIDRSDALEFAAKCCPIDVGLWRIALGRTPNWWPTGSESGETIDESVARVMGSLKSLFHEQSRSRDDWLLVQGSGLIEGKNVHVELEIYGVFQKCLGPREPEVAEVLRGFRWKVSQRLVFDSWIKFSGRLIPGQDSTDSERIGDWEITPAFTRVESPVVTRWQWWRHCRQVWAPALCLIDGSLHVTVKENGIFYDHESSPVGSWADWSWGLRDKRNANLPPATGQALFVRRGLLEAFSDTNRSTFCWLWRMTGYHRRGNHGKYDTFSFEGELGATRICLD